MGDIMDKIINLYKVNKKVLLCILVITLIGVISGSLFISILSNTDKATVVSSISSFFDDLNNNSINYSMALKTGLITNLLYILFIWIMGISIIGLPIVLFLYFTKTFILGFTLVSIITNYGVKGCVYAFFYIFPHQVINILIYAFLSIYALIYSSKIIYAFFKKQTIDFKPIISKYKYILVISILFITLTALYQTFVMPNLLKIVLKLIK